MMLLPRFPITRMKSIWPLALSFVNPPITSARPGSPALTSSTLMTSAPQSASAAPADGTYVHDASSTTRTPRSTSDIASLSLSGHGHCQLPADLLQVSVGAAEEGAPAEQALEVQMSVVLPGVADAAEHLDRGVGDGGQLPRECLGAHGGQVALRGLCGVGRPQRVHNPAAREFHRLVHVDAEVLDRLKAPNRLVELPSHLGVFDGEVHHRVRGTKRVGRVGDH